MAYFNHNEYMYAIDIISTNPLECIRRFEEYFKKYPLDFSAYPYYIVALVNVRRIDEAQNLLDKLIKLVNDNPSYKKQAKFSKYFQKNLFFAAIKLYLYQGRYLDAYKLYTGSPEYKFDDSDTILLYCKKKLGLLTDEDKQKTRYIHHQIVNYSYESFRLCLRRHLPGGEQFDKNSVKVIFSEDFPLDKILQEISKYISPDSDFRLYTGYFEDSYIFRFDNCGKIGNKTVNFFKVICFHGTTDIYTMFPCEDNAMPIIDLNFLKDEKRMSKSQIEKFNNRYRRKDA